MEQIESWEQLFEKWEVEADKYSALNRLRQYYDSERLRILNPYHEELFKHIDTDNSKSISAEKRNELYKKVKPSVDNLESWYVHMIQEICKYFE